MNKGPVFGNNALTGSDQIPSTVESALSFRGTKGSLPRITKYLHTIYLISWSSEDWKGGWDNGGHNDITIAGSRGYVRVQ